MTENRRTTIDALTVLGDMTGASSTGPATGAGSMRVLDLGDGATDADMIVNVSAINLSGNQSYRLALQGCSGLHFNAGVVELGSLTLAGTGRHHLPFSTRGAFEASRYIRLYLTVAGTSPSVTFLAFLAK